MSDVNQSTPKFVYEPDEAAGRFVMLIAQEGVPTVDGRMFSEGAIDWRDLPIPLTMNRVNTAEGQHKTAVGIGAITSIERDGSNIYGRGYFSSDEAGQEARALIKEGTISGVSADVGGVTVQELGAEDDGYPEGVRKLFTKGTIIGVTALLHASFNNTKIAVDESEDALTAAAARGWAPPADAFKNPNLSQPTPLTVTEDGRVYGHAAVWGTCHVGYKDRCVTPPRSTKQYQFFNTGQVHTLEGKPVTVGRITANTGHAPIEFGAQPAKEHYDHTGFAAAYVQAGEDQHGIWFAGVVAPDATDAQIANLRAAGVSGDWRNINGGLEMVGLLAVNTPGFPVPRPQTNIVAGAQMSLVAAGIVDMMDTVSFDLTSMLAEQLKILLADTNTVYHAAHGYHWNVKGKDFAQYHELFANIYGDLYGSIDPIAENILKLEEDAPFSLAEFMQYRTITETYPGDGAVEMATALLGSINELIDTLKVSFDAATAANEQGIANFIADRIDKTQTWAWQLRSSVGAQGEGGEEMEEDDEHDCGCGCGGECGGDDYDEAEQSQMVPPATVPTMPGMFGAEGTEDCGCGGHGYSKKKKAGAAAVGTEGFEFNGGKPVDWSTDLDQTFLAQTREHLQQIADLGRQATTMGTRLNLPTQTYAAYIRGLAQAEVQYLDRSLGKSVEEPEEETNEIPSATYSAELSIEAQLMLLDLDLELPV